MFGLRRLWREDPEAAETTSEARPSRDAGASSIPTTLDASAEQALDAFVQVLRGFGQHAFDMDHESQATFHQECEAWAWHLLILEPAPRHASPVAQSATAPDADARTERARKRDWPAVIRF